jgi:primase-polymerase (primpol)-like protein
MSLAIILWLGIFGVSPAGGHVVPAAQAQSTTDQQTTKPPQSSATPVTNSAQPAARKTQSAPVSKPPSTHAQTAKKPAKGQTKSSMNCDSAAGRNPSAKGSKPNNATAAAGKNSAAVSPCPPKKVIVRQGSTSERGIEVVGGAEGRQASDERDTSIQMLETSEANLKKVEGTQLTSDQQDMVKQVREFMDQSKAATSAGDLDQARTLALKAQLLSEELVRTEK